MQIVVKILNMLEIFFYPLCWGWTPFSVQPKKIPTRQLQSMSITSWNGVQNSHNKQEKCLPRKQNLTTIILQKYILQSISRMCASAWRWGKGNSLCFMFSRSFLWRKKERKKKVCEKIMMIWTHKERRELIRKSTLKTLVLAKWNGKGEACGFPSISKKVLLRFY